MGFFEWLSSLFGSDEDDYKQEQEQEQTKPKKEEPTEEKYVTEQEKYKQTLNKAVEQSKKANIPEPRIIKNINDKIKEYENDSNGDLCIGFSNQPQTNCNDSYKETIESGLTKEDRLKKFCDFREGEQEWIKSKTENEYKSVCELAANKTDFNQIKKLVGYPTENIKIGGKSKKHKNKQKRKTRRHRKN